MLKRYLVILIGFFVGLYIAIQIDRVIAHQAVAAVAESHAKGGSYIKFYIAMYFGCCVGVPALFVKGAEVLGFLSSIEDIEKASKPVSILSTDKDKK